jgi:hypothetical protein
MDSWQDQTAPGLARVDMAVEQVFIGCEKVRGMTVDTYMVEYFVLEAVTDWILPGEDRELFRSQVVLCWNARQAELRKQMGET